MSYLIIVTADTNNRHTIMGSGEHRRSARILELDARRAQSMKSKNTNSEMSKVATEQDSGTRLEHSCRKRGKRKVNFKPLEELVVKDTNHQVEKADVGCDEDHHINAAVVPSTTPMPEKNKLELLLGALQRRDTHKFFSEPVDGKEVEHYYDVIKEPMDFGKIARKLEEGEYSTLEEFEYDVCLIYNNAMLFNASNTIYYRQARAIKELANKLFHDLRSDPENFKVNSSMKRKATSRRVNAEAGILNLNSCNDTNNGCRDEILNCSEADRRGTYRPWTSFLTESKTLLTTVHDSSNELVLNEETGIGYVKSLMHFAKDLGPTATKIARRKAESCIAASLKFQDANLNCQPIGLEVQAPTVGSIQKSIRVQAPSLKLPGNSVVWQMLTGEKIGTQNSILLEKASAVNPVNVNDAISRNIDQTFGKMRTLGNFQGKKIQANSQGTDLGIASKDHMIDLNAGIQLGSAFLMHESGGGKFNFPISDNLNHPENVSFSKMMQDAMLVDSPMLMIDMAPSEATMQDLGPKTNNAGSSSSWSWPSQAMTGSSSSLGYLDAQVVMGSSHNQAIGNPNTTTMKESSCSKSLGYFSTSAMTRSSSNQSVGYLDAPAITGSSCSQAVSHLDPPAMSVPRYSVANGYPNKMNLQNLGGGARVRQNQVGFAAEGSSYRGKSVEGSLLLDLTKPMEWGVQSNVDRWSQQQAGETESNLLGQARSSQQKGWAVTSSPVGHIPKETGPCKNAYEGYQSADLMLGITGLRDNKQQPVWTVNSPPIGQTTKRVEVTNYAYDGYQSADPEMVGIRGLPDNQQQPGWTVTSSIGQTSKGAGATKYAYEGYRSPNSEMVGIRGLPNNYQQPGRVVTSPLIGQTSTGAGATKYACDGYQSTDPEMMEIRALLDNQQQPRWTVTSLPVGKTSKGAGATKYAYGGYQSADSEMEGVGGLPDNQQPDRTVMSPIGQASKGAGATKYAYEGYQSVDPKMIGISFLQDSQQQPGWNPPMDDQGMKPPNVYQFLAPSEGKLSMRERADNSQRQGWASNAFIDAQSRKMLSVHENARISMPSVGESGVRVPIDDHQKQPIVETERTPWLLGL